MNFIYILYIVSLLILSTLIFLISAFFDKKILEYRVLDLMFYLEHFKYDTYKFTYRYTDFSISVNREYKKPFESIKVYINEEEALSMYSLEHTFIKSRSIDCNTKRYSWEILKIIKYARKCLKDKYYSTHKVKYDDYTYFKKPKGKDLDH